MSGWMYKTIHKTWGEVEVEVEVEKTIDIKDILSKLT